MHASSKFQAARIFNMGIFALFFRVNSTFFPCMEPHGVIYFILVFSQCAPRRLEGVWVVLRAGR